MAPASRNVREEKNKQKKNNKKQKNKQKKNKQTAVWEKRLWIGITSTDVGDVIDLHLNVPALIDFVFYE